MDVAYVIRGMNTSNVRVIYTRAVEGLWKKRFVADVPIPHQT